MFSSVDGADSDTSVSANTTNHTHSAEQHQQQHQHQQQQQQLESSTQVPHSHHLVRYSIIFGRYLYKCNYLPQKESLSSNQYAI